MVYVSNPNVSFDKSEVNIMLNMLDKNLRTLHFFKSIQLETHFSLVPE